MVKSCASSRSSPKNEKDPDSRRQRLHRPPPLPARARRDRLGDLRHGHASRPRRGAARRAALPFLRGRHHHQQGVDRVSHPQVRHRGAAGRHRHASHLREAAAAGVRARLRGQPADRARLRAPRQTPRVPLHFRGVRHVARSRFRPGAIAAGVRTDQPPALDLRLLEAADGPSHLGLRPAGGTRFHLVPAVQLDRRRPGLDQHAQGRQLARGDAVLRPHRARRAHPAGRRRQAEARLHLY